MVPFESLGTVYTFHSNYIVSFTNDLLVENRIIFIPHLYSSMQILRKCLILMKQE